MNTALLILALLLAVAGIVGSVVPMLPGPPLAWGGLLLAALREGSTLGWPTVAVAAAVCLAVTLLDYFLPGRLTRRLGGGKAGYWGCNIGLAVSVLGAPFGPTGLLGVVVWPFIGALLGEYWSQRRLRPAARAAFGSFLGFLCGTLAKLAYCLAALIIILAAAL